MKSKDIVKGVAASMGQTQGPVCLVIHEGDLRKIKKGDIIITYSC